MKVNKPLFIIAIVGGATLVYLTIRNKWYLKFTDVFAPLDVSNSNKPSIVFNSLSKEYDPAILNAAERIYKLESANFTSNIYLKTFSAGMIATTTEFPYGWTSLKSLWQDKSLKPVGLYRSENTNNYIIFPNLRAGVIALMTMLEVYKASGKQSPAGAWNGGESGTYVSDLMAFKPDTLITETVIPNLYLSQPFT